MELGKNARARCPINPDRVMSQDRDTPQNPVRDSRDAGEKGGVRQNEKTTSCAEGGGALPHTPRGAFCPSTPTRGLPAPWTPGQ